MDLYDKLSAGFQVFSATVFVLFSIFNFVRSLVNRVEFFYVMGFGIMLILSIVLIKISIKELKKGGEQ